MLPDCRITTRSSVDSSVTTILDSFSKCKASCFTIFVTKHTTMKRHGKFAALELCPMAVLHLGRRPLGHSSYIFHFTKTSHKLTRRCRPKLARPHLRNQCVTGYTIRERILSSFRNYRSFTSRERVRHFCFAISTSS